MQRGMKKIEGEKLGVEEQEGGVREEETREGRMNERREMVL